MTHLHDYKLIYNSIEATVEICTKQGCHNRLVTKKAPNGAYNQTNFYNEHKRDFLQPYMKEYYQEYVRN